jgi:hypothetical protein
MLQFQYGIWSFTLSHQVPLGRVGAPFASATFSLLPSFFLPSSVVLPPFFRPFFSLQTPFIPRSNVLWLPLKREMERGMSGEGWGMVWGKNGGGRRAESGGYNTSFSFFHWTRGPRA